MLRLDGGKAVGQPCTILPYARWRTGLTIGWQTAFALGAFATTITTLACALVEWRGLSTANAFVGNFFFIAGIGMVLSAQWELVRGNSYNYTVFSAYGDYYHSTTKTNILKNKDDLCEFRHVLRRVRCDFDAVVWGRGGVCG